MTAPLVFPSRARRLAMRAHPFTGGTSCNPAGLETLRAAGGNHSLHPGQCDPAGAPGRCLTVIDEDRAGSAPLSATLPGTGPGGSLERVLKRRLQMVERGHTPHTDLHLGRGALLHKASYYAKRALEFVRMPHVDKSHSSYRHHIATMVAYGLAELDRLDLEMQEKGEG